MVYKSIDHRKLLSILFLELKKKYERKWLYFLLRKRRVHLTSLSLSVLLWAIATSQSTRGNFDTYCIKCWVL